MSEIVTTLSNRTARKWYQRALLGLIVVVMMSSTVFVAILTSGCASAKEYYSIRPDSVSLDQAYSGHDIKLYTTRNGGQQLPSDEVAFTKTGGHQSISISTGGRLSTSLQSLEEDTFVTVNVTYKGKTVLTGINITVRAKPADTGPGTDPGDPGDPLDPNQWKPTIQNPSALFWNPVDYTNVRIDGVADDDKFFGASLLPYISSSFGDSMPMPQDPGTPSTTDPHVFYNRNTGVTFHHMNAVWTPDGSENTRNIYASRVGKVIEVVKNVGDYNNTRRDGRGNYIIVEHEIPGWEQASGLLNFSLRNVGPVIKTSSNKIKIYTLYGNLKYNNIYVKEGDIVGGDAGEFYGGQETTFPYGTPIAKMGRTGFTHSTSPREQLYFEIYTKTSLDRLLGKDTVHTVYFDPFNGEKVIFINDEDVAKAKKKGKGNSSWVYVSEDKTIAQKFMWSMFKGDLETWGQDVLGWGLDKLLDTLLDDSMNEFLKDIATAWDTGSDLYDLYKKLEEAINILLNFNWDGLWQMLDDGLDALEDMLQAFADGFVDLFNGLEALGEQLGNTLKDLLQRMIAQATGLPSYLEGQINTLISGIQYEITDFPARMLGHLIDLVQTFKTQLTSLLKSKLGAKAKFTASAKASLKLTWNIKKVEVDGVEKMAVDTKLKIDTDFKKTFDYDYTLPKSFEDFFDDLIHSLTAQVGGVQCRRCKGTTFMTPHEFHPGNFQTAFNTVWTGRETLYDAAGTPSTPEHTRYNELYKQVVFEILADMDYIDLDDPPATIQEFLTEGGLASIYDITYPFDMMSVATDKLLVEIIGLEDILTSAPSGPDLINYLTAIKYDQNPLGAVAFIQLLIEQVWDEYRSINKVSCTECGGTGISPHGIVKQEIDRFESFVSGIEDVVMDTITYIPSTLAQEWTTLYNNLIGLSKTFNRLIKDSPVGMIMQQNSLLSFLDKLVEDTFGPFIKEVDRLVKLIKDDIIEGIKDAPEKLEAFSGAIQRVINRFQDGSFAEMLKNFGENFASLFDGNFDWSSFGLELLTKALSDILFGMDSWIRSAPRNFNKSDQSLGQIFTDIFKDFGEKVLAALKKEFGNAFDKVEAILSKLDDDIKKIFADDLFGDLMEG